MITQAREYFNVIFLTCTNSKDRTYIKEEMERIIDECIVIPSIYNKNLFTKFIYTVFSWIFTLKTGLKKSNFVIGNLEFSEKRIKKYLKTRSVDLVIYEYWHGSASTNYFKNQSIPVFLDMHDILSSAYRIQLERHKNLPEILKTHLLRKYTKEELRAWSRFDGIIAINKLEFEEVKKLNVLQKIFYCPMGIDLRYWNFSYKTVTPIRFGFYGGLGSTVNNFQALKTINEIMPLVWKQLPESQLWLIGSNPRPELLKISETNSQVFVTGFLEDVRPILRTMIAVFCPWVGIFGFRSRVIELMALGIAVIASPDAIAGMGLLNGNGILLANSNEEFAKIAIEIAANESFNQKISRRARLVVENQFSYGKTYGNLFRRMDEIVKNE